MITSKLLLLFIGFYMPEGKETLELPILIWTRRNPHSEIVVNAVHGGENLYIQELNGSVFNPQSPIKVLLHGFMDQGRTNWILDFKDAFLHIMDINVLSLDWRFYAGSSLLHYPIAVAKIHTVGNVMSLFLQNLFRAFNIQPEQVHIIGFSLGAQIGGVIANTLPQKVGRVTGLDPAGFIFRFINKNSRISRSSANFVDIIHSTTGFVGLSKPMGHVDFYPNAGKRSQPGCELENIITKRCSHFYSVKLFYHSILNPEFFIARKCENWANYYNEQCMKNEKTHLGLHVNTSMRGIFFLHTSSIPPFNMSEFISGHVSSKKESFWKKLFHKILSFFGI